MAVGAGASLVKTFLRVGRIVPCRSPRQRDDGKLTAFCRVRVGFVSHAGHLCMGERRINTPVESFTLNCQPSRGMDLIAWMSH